MAVTRSAARAAMLDEHPEIVHKFREGVGSVLRQWTALELAIHHQWGGEEGDGNFENLLTEIVQLFMSPEKIYKDDVTLLLDDYMDTYFYTICEDGSTDEIGDLFVRMWRECCSGSFTLVENALAREFMRHDMITKSEGLEGGDIDDGSDDGVGGKLPPVDEDDLGEDEAVDEDGGMEVANESRGPDPDGWETVARGKKSKKGKK